MNDYPEYPGYIGIREASRAGVVPGEMEHPGVICERCGAVVAGVDLHNRWHDGQQEVVDWVWQASQ
jgi:hypothetical protein